MRKVTPLLNAAVVGLGLLFAFPAPARAIEVAETLFVDLDAADLPADTTTWTNNASDPSVGNFTAQGTLPSVTQIEGASAVTFTGAEWYSSANFAPAGLTGANPTATIEAWVYNPDIPDEETIVSWGHRGGPECGTNMSFNYGTSPYHGAVGHWCNLPGQDIGWGTVPYQAQWHYLVYTYDGAITRVYVDGVKTNEEDDTVFTTVGGIPGISTHPNDNIRIAAQYELINTVWTPNLLGSLSIGRLRIHEGVLTDLQISNNYNEEKASFPIVPIAPIFLDKPIADDVSFKTLTTYTRNVRLDGFPIPLVEVVEPAGGAVTLGGTFGLDVTFTYAIPSPAPDTFVVTLRATNEGGSDEMSWNVTLFDKPTSLEIATNENGEQILFVDLDAADDSAGTDVWINNASDPSVGDFIRVGAPEKTTILGAPAVYFNRCLTNDAYTSENPAPAGIIGMDPTRSIEVWAYNPSIAQEETMVAFGYRGGPNGTNMSFNYGNNFTWGAVGHWDWPDIGWGALVAPAAGRWHHLVYTYDGTTTRVYSDGVEANNETLGAGIINTWPGKINLAVQNANAAGAPEWGIPGTLALSKVRIHDGVLDPMQVMNNYLFEMEAYKELPPPPVVGPEKIPMEPAHRYSFDEDALDSIQGFDGIPFGNVTFENGQAILNNDGSQGSAGNPPSGAYIDLPNGIISALGNNMTIETWTTWNTINMTPWQRIFDFGGTTTGEDNPGTGTTYIFMTPYNGGIFRVGYRYNPTGVERVVDGPAMLTVGNPYHIVFVWDGDNCKTQLYLDGQLLAEGAPHFTLAELPDINVWLGRSNWGADAAYAGSYDEFRIYDYALNGNQVLGNFEAGPDVLNLIPPKAEVVRNISKETFGPGETVDVSLAISMKEGDTAILINEILPTGASASNISDSGTLDQGVIRWDLSGIGAAKTVTYKLVPGSCTGYLRYGRSSWKVSASMGYVTGDSVLSLDLVEQELTNWTSSDIGTAGGASAPLGAHDILVQGDGQGIKLTRDEFRFVYIPLSGDFEFSARIDCFDNPTGKGQVGIIVRNTVDVDSTSVFFALTSINKPVGGVGTIIGMQRRDTGKTALPITMTSNQVVQLPITLRFRRVKSPTDTLYFERSDDGSTFIEVGQRKLGATVSTINLLDNVLIGLAATGGDVGLTVRASFGAVSGPEFQTGALPPAKPTGLTATPGDGKVNLDWNDNAEADLQGYDVYRDGAKVASLVQGSAYEDKGLTNGQQYCYRVRAVNPGGSSPDSDEACATPQPVGAKFRRGDTNDDGKVDLSDAIVTLSYLFQGGTTPTCFDAADADDSGVMDLTDGIYPLTWLFQGGPEPPPPGPKDCGIDTTPQKPGQKPFPACVYTKCP